MKHKGFRVTLVLGVLVMLLLMTPILTQRNTFIQAAEQSDSNVNYAASDGYSVYMSSEQYIFANTDTATVTYKVESKTEITSVTPTVNNLILSEQSVVGEFLHFTVSCPYGVTEGYMSVGIQFASGRSLAASLYVLQNEHGVFVSPSSKDDAHEWYYVYAIENDILTEEQCAVLRNERYRVDVYNVNSLVSSSNVNMASSVSPMTVSSDTSKYIYYREPYTIFGDEVGESNVHGTITWKDAAGNYHPLRRVAIEICHNNSGYLDVLGIVYTDENGYYTFDFFNNTLQYDGYNITLRIYSGDGNVYVRTSTGVDYTYMVTAQNNFTTGASCLCNVAIGQDETTISDFRKSIIIGQAALTARDYAWHMQGTLPGYVNIYYPYNRNNSGYSYSNRRIMLPSIEYNFWDVITHEYGHHMHNSHGIDSPGEEHGIEDLICTKGKTDGIRLAWCEAWATVYGQASQLYFWEDYEDDIVLYSADSIISTVADQYYTAMHNTDEGIKVSHYNFDTGPNVYYPLGEGSEIAIITLLYDLIDGGSNDDDVWSLSLSDFWDLTLEESCGSLSDFSAVMIENTDITNMSLLEHYNAVGDLFDSINVSPLISLHQTASVYELPTWSYSRGGYAEPKWDSEGNIVIDENGNIKYEELPPQRNVNNSFEYVIYASDGTTLYTKNVVSLLTETSQNESEIMQWCLTDIEWNNVLSSGVDVIYIQVKGYQTNTPSTGPYMSKVIKLDLNIPYVSRTMGNISVLDSECSIAWCRFDVPCNGTYRFTVEGSCMPYVELFTHLNYYPNSVTGRFAVDDDYDGVLTYDLQKDDIVYVRIRSFGLPSGTVTLSPIELINHTHDYTDHYEAIDATGHKSYCACGEYITSAHTISPNLIFQTCQYCNYIVSMTPGVINPIFP